MKSNRSLAISTKIHECKSGDILGLLDQEFPKLDVSNFMEPDRSRNRVFTVHNTLLTMVLTALHQDKTLQQSVSMYYRLHQQHKARVISDLQASAARQRQADQQAGLSKAGRPRKYRVEIPRSLAKDISLNTAAYSKARNRIPVGLTQALFKASRIEAATNTYTHWHGRRVFIADGTYVQMQDTAALRQDYEVKHNGVGSAGYPQGLLEVIIERGTGQVYSFNLSNRHVSELSVFYEMIDQIPKGSVLLLDALYNCFEIIAKCRRKGIDLVIPAKRERNYELTETLGPGDEIIRIEAPRVRSKWLAVNENPDPVLLRRISCKSPDGKEYVLHTSILDKDVPGNEIQTLYVTRWDIEIGIREIKTIMDVHVLRAKTPEMVFKELTVSLAAYNLIRKLIYASIKDLPFSPEEDFIQKFYTLNQSVLMDKRGRVYNQWSTGRKKANTNID